MDILFIDSMFIGSIVHWFIYKYEICNVTWYDMYVQGIKIDVQKTLYVHCNVHQLMMFFSVHVSFYCVCIYMVWYGVWYDMMWDKHDVRKIHKLYWSNMIMMWFDDMILCTSTIHIYIDIMIWYDMI